MGYFLFTRISSTPPKILQSKLTDRSAGNLLGLPALNMLALGWQVALLELLNSFSKLKKLPVDAQQFVCCFHWLIWLFNWTDKSEYDRSESSWKQNKHLMTFFPENVSFIVKHMTTFRSRYWSRSYTDLTLIDLTWLKCSKQPISNFLSKDKET